MNTMVADRPMAKGRAKKPGGEGTLVRIDADLVTKARYLAAQQGVHMSELLSGILRPVIDQMFRKAGKDLWETEDKPAPKGKGGPK